MGRRPAKSGEERARLKAVRAFDLEESRPAFERIARVARRLSNAPFAHVSFVGPDEVWVAGYSETRFPRVAPEHSFLKYVVESDEVLWIEELRADRRFDGNPFVHGGPQFRCFAGAPVILSGGGRIGSVSIKDRKPRPYDPDLAAALEDLAAMAAQEWERGRAMKALKQSEAVARASNATLRRIVDGAPVALLMTDRKLRTLQTSHKWRTDMQTGMQTGDALIGQSVYDIFPESRARWSVYLERALRGETFRSSRSRITLPTGDQPWVRSEITPWRDQRGRIGGLLIMTYDISDMVEALENMRRTEQTLKLALEIGELSMWEMDHRDRRLNSAGRAVFDDYGGGRDYEAMERDIWYGVHPADLPAAKEALRQSEAAGKPFRATYRLLQRNGPHVWVQSAAEIIMDEQGRPERTVGVLRNIDKQKRSEIALARARDEAEAANRAKSEFLANMSHEIRTPLNGVMGVASALSRMPLDPNQREMVGLIESSAKTLESLLSDVLDLARVESGRLALVNEPFDLQRCIADVGALFHPSAEAKNLDLVIEPASEIEGVFLGDATRIRQILSNLVANAVKFTPAGEVRVGASALRTPIGVEAKIWVKDTGIGFDEEAKGRLFGRFEQADGSITRRYGGTGLGLAISRSLAERMGGALEADASPGLGAVFTLSLPLTRVADAPSAAEPSGACAAGDAQAALKVLLAEDHPTNRRVVQLILESIGVDLTCVENGAQAVQAWEQGDFELVLMDMQMPVMDGLTAIRRIRAEEAARGRRPVRIYALTANAMPEHAKATRDAGADGHLTKPILADSLFRTVEQAAAALARPSGERSMNVG